jgi:hypothetical protein
MSQAEDRPISSDRLGREELPLAILSKDKVDWA